jgi:hypothetical protein
VLRLLLANPVSELDLEEELLSLPKKEKKFRKARAKPPLSLVLLPLEAHEILRGAPPAVLKPPSISVYTTGSSRSAALLPPVNLPTANPPPGSLHIVNPTVSSSPISEVSSEGLPLPLPPPPRTSVGS